MRSIVLVPLLLQFSCALAAPNAAQPFRVQQRPSFPTVPALSVDDWSSIQGGLGKAWNAVKGCMGWLASAEEAAHVVHVETRSVYKVLSEDETFSKLVTLINLDEDAIQYLDDYNETFTIFAPTNEGFPESKPHELPQDFGDPTSLNSLYRYFLRFPTEDSDDEPNRRQGALHILHGVLQYHILARETHTATSLAENSTVTTSLQLPGEALLSTPQRLRVSPALRPLPTLQLNFLSYVTRPDIAAANGIVHAIDRPLIPPLAAAEALYAVPALFSVSSSVFGKTGLAREVAWSPHWDGEDGDGLRWVGNPAVTVFAPTNAAWAKLPPKLAQFLHSPWGQRALKKLLQFHVVNDTVLHSDFLRKGEEEDDLLHPPTYELDFLLPTLLPNHPLPIHVSKTKPLPLPGVTRYTMTVQDKTVEILDGVARNGAVHVVGELLNPLKGKHRHGGEGDGQEEGVQGWEEWEEWLPAWAEMA